MKTLLRCAALFCLSFPSGSPAIAESTASPNIQPPLIGTWLYAQGKNKALIIFSRDNEVSVLEEKTYGDYQYYQLPTANFLIDQLLDNDALKIQPRPKYQLQGNVLTVTESGFTDDRRRLEFTADGRNLSLVKVDIETDKFTLQRVSDSTEPPANTESQQALEGSFYGLKKLLAIQTAQTNYWQQQRHFATKIQKLPLPPLPASDQLYKFKILRVNQRESTIAAIPNQPYLRGYVLRLDRRGLRQQPFLGILCGTDRPSDQSPPLPQSKNNQLTCSGRTHKIEFSYPISRSLLQLPTLPQ